MFFLKSPEREFETQVAQATLLNCNKEFKLQFEQHEFGEQFPIFKTYLTDESHNQFIGGGKGFGILGQVSSLAEALQHFIEYSTIYLLNKNQQTTFLSAEKIFTAPHLNKYIKYKNLLEKYPNKHYECLSYQNFANKKEYLYYPLAMSQVRYKYFANPNAIDIQDLAWRSHDTGSSFGLSFSEAMLHGINEWIEKDSYAKFLINSFFTRSAAPAKIISRQTMPAYIQEFIKYINEKFADDLIIIDITSELKIPSFVVTFQNQSDCHIQPKGLACSLDKDYALEKAIFEALQCRLLYNENSKLRQLQMTDNFSKYQMFLNACILNLDKLNKHEVNFADLPNYNNLTVNEQVAHINNTLIANSYIIYYRKFMETQNYCSLHVLIPGMNESFLIKEGKFIHEKI